MGDNWMMLSPGDKLGSFDISSLLGVGGMGEVYGARDTKLGREVAIKVLPKAISQQPETLARFRREARVLASLNHPHIAAIYSLEQSGDTRFLVLEYVEGPTLSERLSIGPLELDKALSIGAQMAEALEVAHEKGIIHRDLKPENIKITSEGKAKLLDFGLAKTLEGSADTGTLDRTLTLDEEAPEQTREGVILGTVPYMSPEQARGEPTDRRTDIWSFGCVLFKMLTGKRPFSGHTVAEVLAEILKTEPDWTLLPSETPVSVRELLRRCLEKDSAQRLRDIGEARITLSEPMNSPSIAQPSSVFDSLSRRAKFARTWKILATGGALLFIVSSILLYRSQQGRENAEVVPTDPDGASLGAVEPPRPKYSQIALPADQPLAPAIIFDTSLALSPDGSLLVYRGMEGSSVRLYLRRLGQLGGTLIEGTHRADRPFFSPDGKWIGFVGYENDSMKLMKRPVAGGLPQPIAKLTIAFPAHWGDDHHIVYTPAYGSGLMRVSSDGGEPEALTTLQEGEFGHSFPFVLPGSKAVLYTGFTQPTVEAARLMLYDRETKESRLLFQQAGGGKYIDTGHIIYSQRGALMAAPFDLETLTVTGPSFEVTDLRMVEPDGTPNRHAISKTGILAYIPVGLDDADALSLIWVDLEGNETDLGAPRAGYQNISIAPNGRDALVEIWNAQDSAIWLYDLERLTAMRLTFSPSSFDTPLWMNDGRRFLYTSNRTGRWDLHLAHIDDPDNPETILGFQNASARANVVMPDQNAVIYTYRDSTFSDLLIVSLDDDRSVRPLLDSPYYEFGAALSSDGKWLAYASDESGRMQVYMRSYPELTAKTQISVSGGAYPQWSPDGQTLYFLGTPSSNRIMAVPLSFDPSPSPDPPQLVYEGAIHRAFLHPNGDRFLVVKRPTSGELRIGGREIIVVENWFEEVRRRESLGHN